MLGWVLKSYLLWRGPYHCVPLLCTWDTRERWEHAGRGAEVVFVVTWSLSLCAIVVQMGYVRKTRTCWAGCWRRWRCWTRTTPTVWPSMPGRMCAATGPTTPTLTGSSWKSKCSKYCSSLHLLLVPTPSVGLCPRWFAAPKGGQGCLMFPSCLESQGCHLIPLSYLLSCFFCLVLLLFLSCHFSANGPFWLFSRKLINIFC